MFDPMPDLAIVFVCVAIEHAIREYQTGRHTVTNFEGEYVNGQLKRFMNCCRMGLIRFRDYQRRKPDYV